MLRSGDEEAGNRPRRYRRAAAPAALHGARGRGGLPPPRTREGLGLDLEADLARAVGRRVQLVVLNRAPVDLIHRVLRDGILLKESDPSARIRFEVKARREYFDLLPILRRYRRMEARP